MSTVSDLKHAAGVQGAFRTEQGGWSIVLSRPGNPTPEHGWMLSGKRQNGMAPNAKNLEFLRRLAVEAGAPDVDGEQIVSGISRGGGTWVWKWDASEEDLVLLKQIARTQPQDIVSGVSWNQGMDPIDPRYAIVTMRYPSGDLPLAHYQGREAIDRMKRFCESYLAGARAGRTGREYDS